MKKIRIRYIHLELDTKREYYSDLLYWYSKMALTLVASVLSVFPFNYQTTAAWQSFSLEFFRAEE